MAGVSRKSKCDKLLKEIFQTVFHFKDRMRKRLISNHDDLSPEQAMVLFLIESNEGKTMSDLANSSNRDKTTMTRMIDGLEKINHVVRTADQTDHRQTLIYLTRSGKRKIEEIKSIKPDMLDIAFNGLQSKELEITFRTLQKIRENLEEGKS